MKRYSLFLMALLLPVAAQAQTLPTYCRLLPEHKATQGAEYVPGVDVHGKPVVPADINTIEQPVVSPVIIPIEVDLVSRFNLTVPQDVNLVPYAAFLKVYPDGRVTYNDQDISSQAYVLCGKEPEITGNNPSPANGQAAQNGLISGEMPEPAPVLGEPVEGQSP